MGGRVHLFYCYHTSFFFFDAGVSSFLRSEKKQRMYTRKAEKEKKRPTCFNTQIGRLSFRTHKKYKLVSKYLRVDSLWP